MELESCVPPGFRFHPTEEELVGYYLKRKVTSLKIDLDVITDIDLYRMEPWDIEDRCKLGYEEQSEWYFFSHKDRKYPTGRRTNRATAAGFWKATGRDKAVLSKERIIGMRKTLVYYRGRAPNGRKSDWIMHEYRLQTSEHEAPQEEGWVVCRAFKKPSPSHKQGGCNYNTYYITNSRNYRPTSDTDPQSEMQNHDHLNQGTTFRDSPSISTTLTTSNNNLDNLFFVDEHVEDDKSNFGDEFGDWKNFDKLLASQVFEPSMYACTNMPLHSHTDEFDAQSHLNNVFGCFPDL